MSNIIEYKVNPTLKTKTYIVFLNNDHQIKN